MPSVQIQRLGLLDLALVGEMFQYELTSGITQGSHQLRRREHPGDGGGKRHRITGRNRQAGLTVEHNFSGTVNSGRNYRASSGQRLDSRQWETFIKGRQYREVGEREPIWYVRLPSDERDRAGYSKSDSLRYKHRSKFAITCAY